MMKSIAFKKINFVLVFICIVTGQHATAAVTPVQAVYWHDSTARLSTKSPAKPAEKKAGFYTRVKDKVLSFLVTKAMPKKSANTRNAMGFIGLGLVLVGLASLLFGGPFALFLLLPLGVLTSIVALFIKNRSGEETSTAGSGKKRKSNVAALIAIGIGTGIIAFFLILSFSMGGHW